MDVFNAISRRYSVRAYKATDVEEDKLPDFFLDFIHYTLSIDGD